MLFSYSFPSSLPLRKSVVHLTEYGKRVLHKPTHLADFGAALTSGESHQQAVLECLNVMISYPN